MRTARLVLDARPARSFDAHAVVDAVLCARPEVRPRLKLFVPFDAKLLFLLVFALEVAPRGGFGRQPQVRREVCLVQVRDQLGQREVLLKRRTLCFFATGRQPVILLPVVVEPRAVKHPRALLVHDPEDHEHAGVAKDVGEFVALPSFPRRRRRLGLHLQVRVLCALDEGVGARAVVHHEERLGGAGLRLKQEVAFLLAIVSVRRLVAPVRFGLFHLHPLGFGGFGGLVLVRCERPLGVGRCLQGRVAVVLSDSVLLNLKIIRLGVLPCRVVHHAPDARFDHFSSQTHIKDRKEI